MLDDVWTRILSKSMVLLNGLDSRFYAAFTVFWLHMLHNVSWWRDPQLRAGSLWSLWDLMGLPQWSLKAIANPSALAGCSHPTATCWHADGSQQPFTWQLQIGPRSPRNPSPLDLPENRRGLSERSTRHLVYEEEKSERSKALLAPIAFLLVRRPRERSCPIWGAFRDPLMPERTGIRD